MLTNPGFVVRFAPLLATLALMLSCCYLYDIKPPTPITPPSPTPACVIKFTNPKNGAVLPGDGLVTFSWTAVPNAKLYILSIAGPGNSPAKVTYPVNNGTSWPVDMGSIGGDGSYTAAVQARDADQNIICQTQIKFSRLTPTATRTPTPTRTSQPTKTATKVVKAHKAPAATATKTAPPPTKKPTPTRKPTQTPIIIK